MPDSQDEARSSLWKAVAEGATACQQTWSSRVGADPSLGLPQLQRICLDRTMLLIMSCASMGGGMRQDGPMTIPMVTVLKRALRPRRDIHGRRIGPLKG